jgi:putative ABC transport system permease protein
VDDSKPEMGGGNQVGNLMPANCCRETKKKKVQTVWQIAWNNLRHDWLRTLAAVVGISFAVTLAAVQVAIFLGAIENGARLIHATDADIWIVPEQSSSADFAVTMPDRRKYQALGVPGVRDAGRMVVAFSIWRFNDGRQEAVVVVGADDNRDWLRITGKLERRFLRERAVLLDRREEARFGTGNGPLTVGEIVELNGHRADVAGFVDRMISFVVTSYVFSRYEAALQFSNITPGSTTFIVVKIDEGADIAQVQQALRGRLSDVEVLTREEFASRSWRYWVLGTGMGMALALSAGLALVVGMVVVGQTMFTSVLSKLREFATLKAVGFGNGFVTGIVAWQCIIVAVLGYACGLAATLVVARFAGSGGTAVAMRTPPMLLVGMGPLALGLCLFASVGAAAKVMLIAPAKVFR